MSTINPISNKYFLGAIIPNVKILSAKIDEIITNVNDLNDGEIETTDIVAETLTLSGDEAIAGLLNSSNTTEADTSYAKGAIITAGGLGVAKNIQVGKHIVSNKTDIANRTAVACDTTAAATLAVVNSGLVSGLITSTSAAPVTITLDSVSNIVAALNAAGVGNISSYTRFEFIIDNTAGANTVTLAVDGGATIAVATPAITGGANLDVTTANKIGIFSLYIISPTSAILSRIV